MSDRTLSISLTEVYKIYVGKKTKTDRPRPEIVTTQQLLKLENHYLPPLSTPAQFMLYVSSTDFIKWLQSALHL